MSISKKTGIRNYTSMKTSTCEEVLGETAFLWLVYLTNTPIFCINQGCEAAVVIVFPRLVYMANISTLVHCEV
jgi:hypothetical protein